jgi:5'-nucleotidase
MNKNIFKILAVVIILSMIIPVAAFGKGHQVATLTLLHTNDFHGRLEADSSGRGGAANLMGVINNIRRTVGEKNVLLLDAGDEFFAAPAISQLLMGESVIDVFNMMGYELAVFGNHEFDKGQEVLQDRVAQSEYPWLGANIVIEGTEWDHPTWAKPYVIIQAGEPRNPVRLGVIGVDTDETPEVTLIGTTAGLEFKDLTESILHYYDEVKSQSDALIVVAHMGTDDSGPYKGLKTIAQELIDAGKPVDLMIGGHQHQAISTPVYVGNTPIVSAGYYGRYLGRVDVSIELATKKLTVENYQLITVTNPKMIIADLIDELVNFYAAGDITNDVVYSMLLKHLEDADAAYAVGLDDLAVNRLYAFISDIKAQYDVSITPEAADKLIADAYYVLSTLPDTEIAERVAYWSDIVAPIVNEPVALTNIDLYRDYNAESVMGDIVTDSMRWKADWYDDGELNGSVDIAFTNPGGLRADIIIPDGAPLPYTITWGMSFDVLPFGNTMFYMDLTGAQIQELLDQSATLYKGILQSSGCTYYWYNDTGTNKPTAWGAYGVEVNGEPLVRDKIYRVVTNNFLAGGQDGWVTFAEGTNRWDSYYDMQEGFVEYLKMLEVVDAEDVPMDRIVRLDDVVTMMHVNDTHGRWEADKYGGGMVYVADLIEKERAHNPHALLLDMGDTFQGNSFAYFFKDRPDNPIAGGMNFLGFDAMVIGNHEFNFGPTTFATMLGQLNMPLLGKANLDDDGSYGFINDNVEEYINLEVNGKKVTIYGLTNPRVYRYELPTNIPGLTFHGGQESAEVDIPMILAAENPDLMVAMTHIGYSPYGDEIDSDLLIAENVPGIDVIIGGHSHTRLNPAVMVTSAINTNGTLIAQAQRYASWLGKVNVGWIDGEIVLREGYLIPTSEAEVNAELQTYLDPFIEEIIAYNGTEIGETLVPIDGVKAYTEETNSANLQADSAVYVLGSEGIDVDVHLSGAMSNTKIATGASATTPYTLTKGDMFNLMPYENSLVVIEMTGPQIKDVLERSYRNYWWYKYDPAHGGYSYYTTCFLATDAGNVITYNDGGPDVEPDGNNVVSLTLDGVPIDFTDAVTTYLVSTVNYLAAGSCNFNNAGETIWPLDQIVYDTQLYVRDSVTEYVDAQTGPISPAIEGRLVFNTNGELLYQYALNTGAIRMWLPIINK